MENIDWQIGKEEFTREEVEKIVDTQRAMINNDIKMLLIEQSAKAGLKGKLTEVGNQIADELKVCRRPVF